MKHLIDILADRVEPGLREAVREKVLPAACAVLLRSRH